MTHLLPLAVQVASEQGSHPFLLCALAGLLALGLRLTMFVRDVEFERALMKLIQDGLHEAGLSQKDAYLTMGYSKGQWSEICSGVRQSPSLSRLALLPRLFWRLFVWDFAALVMKHKVTEYVMDERRSA